MRGRADSFLLSLRSFNSAVIPLKAGPSDAERGNQAWVAGGEGGARYMTLTKMEHCGPGDGYRSYLWWWRRFAEHTGNIRKGILRKLAIKASFKQAGIIHSSPEAPAETTGITPQRCRRLNLWKGYRWWGAWVWGRAASHSASEAGAKCDQRLRQWSLLLMKVCPHRYEGNKATMSRNPHKPGSKTQPLPLKLLFSEETKAAMKVAQQEIRFFLPLRGILHQLNVSLGKQITDSKFHIR